MCVRVQCSSEIRKQRPQYRQRKTTSEAIHRNYVNKKHEQWTWMGMDGKRKEKLRSRIIIINAYIQNIDEYYQLPMCACVSIAVECSVLYVKWCAVENIPEKRRGNERNRERAIWVHFHFYYKSNILFDVFHVGNVYVVQRRIRVIIGNVISMRQNVNILQIALFMCLCRRRRKKCINLWGSAPGIEIISFYALLKSITSSFPRNITSVMYRSTDIFSFFFLFFFFSRLIMKRKRARHLVRGRPQQNVIASVNHMYGAW